MQVERLDHVHIFVNNLAQATKLFSDALNTIFSPPIPEESTAILASISPLGLEIAQPTSPQSPLARTLEQKGEGLAGLSFKVRNIDEAAEELKALGMRLIGEVKLGGVREMQFHPKDSFGVVIELCEYDEEHPMVTALSKAPAE